MSIILGKIENAFECSGAKEYVTSKYNNLEKMHEEVLEQIKALKSFNDSAFRGETHIEVEKEIFQYEKKLNDINNQLRQLKKSIGGGY